ncbi:hypothetical protein V5N11_029955 [Cardamine amara subsp. amara]|uniref:SWIM-type domain-containing protein n=1 Tax=Cardamine amara subsp. amara TaxID=228776 RepID=A0ABD0ZBJ9_CARAN
MLQIYVMCGRWRLYDNKQWGFIVDEEKRGRLVSLESTPSLEELKLIVLDDYGIKQIEFDVEFSFLPIGVSLDSPPIVMLNDRQVKNFLLYFKRNNNLQLCVTFKSRVDGHSSGEQFYLNNGSNDDANRRSDDAKGRSDDVKGRTDDGNNRRDHRSEDDDGNVHGKSIVLRNSDKTSYHDAKVVDGLVTMMVESMVKTGNYFKSKEILQATMEMYAMKHNCDYRVTKSDTKWWSIRCVHSSCKWSLRAQCLDHSTYLKINKYVGEHTCAPSRKNKFCRTPSARTIGHLIMHNYEGVKGGPKPHDIIKSIRSDWGCELTYSQAWESREYAVNEVRGIPEKSYAKIPKYLYIVQEANPGTFTNYETDCDGRFKYLFISFGQSIRGFNKSIRKVIVVDGTFLKNKYKGVLLVATTVDGNSNLYPIAFGIADSENDRSWEWFLTQLKNGIKDDEGLAFVSDRHQSICKSIGIVYPLAKHGICIHHLINNVITYYKGKSLAGLVAKASKAYRVAEFEIRFKQICDISPAIGGYLKEANVTQWARCHFPGYRYDLNTKNPAESINFALREPREYPIIPLLDSIREFLTRWFYKRRELSAKNMYPLTIAVEKKIDRRIGKGQIFEGIPITRSRIRIKGGTTDFIVDLERRTCSCGKFRIGKIPCRHAIKGSFDTCKDLYRYADDVYTTTAWRSLYEESINPIGVPEEEWRVPEHVKAAKVIAPHTKRQPGRPKKRRHETVEDKIRSSQGSQAPKRHKCSRCGKEGHNRTTCDIAI